MSNERYKSTIAFTDLLFNILVGFAFLFIIAFLLIKPEAKKQDFERKAEFVVVMEWDKGAHGDIDLYVQDPTGAQCSFRFPVANFMHLDKDDLGASNDSVVNADGSVSTVRINREVITIRGIIEGEYIINAHYYSKRMWVDTRPGEVKKKLGITGDTVVKIELHKVTPYSILWAGEKKFTEKGQEETYLRFRLDRDGNLLEPFTFEKKKFVTPLQSAMEGVETSVAPSPAESAAAVGGF